MNRPRTPGGAGRAVGTARVGGGWWDLVAASAPRPPGTGGRLLLTPFDDPRRAHPKPLGWANEGPTALLGLEVADGRMHAQVIGPTGAGKTTHLQHQTVTEAWAGRGVSQFDPQGDLSDGTLERLPAECANRLVIIDPAETIAPPAWNPLHLPGVSPELAAENVVGVFARLYAGWWGPRMEDTLRAACLTLAHRPHSTLADVVPLLMNPAARRHVLAELDAVPAGLENFWEDWEDQTPTQRHQTCGPVVSRLRALFTRRLARDLLDCESTFDLGEILDGGVLIARLPKGVLGEDCCRLVGSLLLAGLWQATTARAARPAAGRPDATVIIDEAHNFLNLPIGVADALTESRGYRVSWVLAHQHLAQLPPEVRAAVDANARNKYFWTLSPSDAPRLVHHVAPYFDESDLVNRPAFEITCRIMHHNRAATPFTVTAPAPLDPIPGRAAYLRAAARARTGLTAAQREHSASKHKLRRSGSRLVRPGRARRAPTGPGHQRHP